MMKKTIFLALLVLLAAATAVSAFEVGVQGNFTNLDFGLGQRSASDTSFSGQYYNGGAAAYLNHSIDERLGIHAGYYFDPILMGSMYTLFTFQENFLTLSVGPFFGLFNSRAALLKAGISTSIKLEFPGIIFLQFRADSSIGGRLVQDGDYTQEKNTVALGFYVPFAICTLGLDIKKFTEKIPTGETIDNLNIYSFKTDLFKKNVPYRVLINFAFHQLTKTFIEDSGTTVHGLNSLVAGFHVDVFASDVITLNFGLDSSIYSFGSDALLGITNPGPGGYLFDASAGIEINIDSIIEKQNL